MLCPKCKSTKTSVTNSRPRVSNSSIWRRRHCPSCGFIFTSEEIPALDSQSYVYSDKSSQPQPFSIGRLTLSIAKAFVHDPDKGRLAAYELARTVEQQLVGKDSQLTDADIYLASQQVLARYDKMAATVYAAQHGVELA